MAYSHHAVEETNVKVVLAGPRPQDILRFIHAKAAPTSRSALEQLALPDGVQVVLLELVPAGLGAARSTPPLSDPGAVFEISRRRCGG